jgi:hypothetical protein
MTYSFLACAMAGRCMPSAHNNSAEWLASMSLSGQQQHVLIQEVKPSATDALRQWISIAHTSSRWRKVIAIRHGNLRCDRCT